MRVHKVLIFILAFRFASSKNGRGARWMPHDMPQEVKDEIYRDILYRKHLREPPGTG